jgi:hypothetical protein
MVDSLDLRGIMTPTFNVYFILRGLTFCVAILLGLLLLSAFVWAPFYAAEGNTPQFQDKILQLIGDFLLFVAIVTPYRWTVASPYYQIRLGVILLTIAWVSVVDLIAYSRALTKQPFTLFSLLTFVVAVLVMATLIMHRNRRKPACH